MPIVNLKDKLTADLSSRYPIDLVNAAVESYLTAKKAALVDDLQKAESHFGQFCEAAIRICRNVITGTFTAIGDPKFGVAKEWDAFRTVPAGALRDEPFRILIPNTIRAMYDIRNRRGGDHLSDIKPNHIDARVLTAQADWILAELTRLATTKDFAKAQTLIDALVDRQIPLIEVIKGEWKLLETDLSVDNAVLLALYHDSSLIQADLVGIVKRSQPTVSAAISKLDKTGFVHKSGRSITITSKGRKRVESLPEVRNLVV